MTTIEANSGVRPAMPSRAITGLILIAAGVLALAGNLLHPRFGGNDVEVYRHLANSTRLVFADALLLPALVLLTIGLVGLAEMLQAASPLAEIGRLLALVGGTIALSQTAVEMYGMRQQARVFAGASPSDQVGAFWSTSSLDRLSSALLATWIVLLLGVTPALLAWVALAARRTPRWLGLLGCAAGAICAGVGVFDLFRGDHSAADIPFLAGSLLLTAWVVGSGWAVYARRQGDGNRGSAAGV